MRETEQARAERMLAFQQQLAGEELLAGMDEAGRGPLCGPVYAACAIMDETQPILGVNDSKKVSPNKRLRLAQEIKQQAIAYGVGSASVEEIERYNILEATKMAMRRAWNAMAVPNAYLLVDGLDPADLGLRGQAVVKGDQQSYSIAAASILAKTERDAVLLEMDTAYPQYGFAQHKGYGTPQHIQALREYGPCPEHRMSFLGKIL